MLPKNTINLFSGPPKDPKDDARLVQDYIASEGMHIVSGGTSSEILSRELKRPLHVNIDYTDSDLPPTASIEGIDMVTEGVLTLKRVIELVAACTDTHSTAELTAQLDAPDGAAKLAKALVEKCTDLKLFIGKAVNPAHQNPDFPTELRVKSRLLDDLGTEMQKLGRRVEKRYY